MLRAACRRLAARDQLQQGLLIEYFAFEQPLRNAIELRASVARRAPDPFVRCGKHAPDFVINELRRAFAVVLAATYGREIAGIGTAAVERSKP
jgi:hypothetical protein